MSIIMSLGIAIPSPTNGPKPAKDNYWILSTVSYRHSSNHLKTTEIESLNRMQHTVFVKKKKKEKIFFLTEPFDGEIDYLMLEVEYSWKIILC